MVFCEPVRTVVIDPICEKAAVPALPVTLDELVATAKECEALGAAIIHVHIRDADAEPTLDQGRLRTTVAAFVGGFKRSHGAFRYGPLALVNHGSHYGFMQQGVVFSKLQPGLATASD